MIDREVIEEIKNEASIVQVINTFIPLTKKGQNYIGICPFHDDHTPSLSVNEQKKIYKCFSCGAGGDVFTFVKEYTKCSYQEAIIKVAELIGKPLEIDNHKPKRDSPFKHLYDVMSDSIILATNALHSTQGVEAKEYLIKRGLTNDIINYFDIGFIPKGNLLMEYLNRKGHNDVDIEKVGLIREARNEITGDFYFYNVFGNRITFPIHDSFGNPIAYTARALEDGDFAKYLNTGETDIFHKGKVVYNLHRAFSEARNTKHIFVCEGVMDVIALKRANIGNAVATLGTACTKEQLQLCGKATENIVLFYDGDKAGRNATMKAIELSISLGLKPSVVVNNTGKDPDEIISTSGTQGLKELVSKKINGIEYAFDYYKGVYPLDSFDNKKAYMEKLDTLIDCLNDNYDKQYFKKELIQITGLPLKDNLEGSLQKTLEATDNLEKLILQAEENSALKEILKASQVLKEQLYKMPDYELKAQERRKTMAEEKKYTSIRFPKWTMSKPYTVTYEDKEGETKEQTRVSIHVPEANGEFGATWQSFSIAEDRIYQEKNSENMFYILMKPERKVKITQSVLNPEDKKWNKESEVIMTPDEIKAAFNKNLENFKNRDKKLGRALSKYPKEQTQETERSR